MKKARLTKAQFANDSQSSVTRSAADIYQNFEKFYATLSNQLDAICAADSKERLSAKVKNRNKSSEGDGWKSAGSGAGSSNVDGSCSYYAC